MFLSERSARAVGIIVTIVALALAGYAIIEGETVEELGGREHTEGKYGYFVVNKTDNTNTRAVVLSLHPLEIEIVK